MKYSLRIYRTSVIELLDQDNYLILSIWIPHNELLLRFHEIPFLSSDSWLI